MFGCCNFFPQSLDRFSADVLGVVVRSKVEPTPPCRAPLQGGDFLGDRITIGKGHEWAAATNARLIFVYSIGENSRHQSSSVHLVGLIRSKWGFLDQM